MSRRSGSKRPVVITHHGKSAVVLLDVSKQEALMQRMEILEDIRLAGSQLARGEGVAHDVALKKALSRVIR